MIIADSEGLFSDGLIEVGFFELRRLLHMATWSELVAEDATVLEVAILFLRGACFGGFRQIYIHLVEKIIQLF